MITGYQIFEPKVSLEVLLATITSAEFNRVLMAVAIPCHEDLDCMLQTGCCQCDNLSPTGWIAVILLLIFFWPLFWIPFVMPECYEVSHFADLKSCPCTCHSKKNTEKTGGCNVENALRSALPAPIALALGMLPLRLTKWAPAA